VSAVPLSDWVLDLGRKPWSLSHREPAGHKDGREAAHGEIVGQGAHCHTIGFRAKDLSPLADRSDLDAISVLAMLVALYAILKLGLLPALLAGLLIAQLVHSAVPVLYRFGIANRKLGRAIALTLVTVTVTTVITLLVVAISSRLTAGPENLFFSSSGWRR
jgi:hypothetical protein